MVNPYRERIEQDLGTPIWCGFTQVDGGTKHWYYVTAPYREQCIDQVHKGPPYKKGGNLTIVKRGYYRTLTEPVNLTNGLVTWEGSFAGTTLPEHPALPVQADPVSQSDMWIAGSKAWAKCKPGKPGASTGTAIGELRQLPSLVGSAYARTRKMSSLGDEYLNGVFGWLPLLGDIRGFYRTQKYLDRRLRQLKRDNGKPVRRKCTLPGSESNVVTIGTGYYLYPTLTTGFYNGVGTRISQTRVTVDNSFAARFRYWIPDINSAEWPARATRALFGLNPTPKLLYDLVPWSWLIDWFSNLGDVLDNMSGNAAENLVADYAYIMRRYYQERNHEETQPLKSPAVTLTATDRLIWEVIQREAASPYDFGLIPTDLTGRQGLILGALGISRIF